MNERKPVKNLNDVAAVLQAHGYEAAYTENSASFQIGSGQKYIAIATVENGQLRISCQVLTAGEIVESKASEFFCACLALNARINPWAIALVTDSKDPDKDEPDEWPLVATDAMPMADLSEQEVMLAVDSLWVALAEIEKILPLAK